MTLRMPAAVFLLVFGAAPSLAQAVQDAFPDVERWSGLADRAESVTAASAASNAALATLRSDLVVWQQNFRAAQEPLNAEIDLLRSRLAALGDPVAGEAADSELADRRSEIESRLLDVETPLRIAEDAIRHADGLIDRIDEIRRARIWQARATRGATLLDPADWFASARLLAEHLDRVSGNVGASWAIEARRARYLQDLPITLLLLAAGGMCFTAMRGGVTRLAERLFPGADGGRPRGGGFRALLRDVILPVVGINFVFAAIDGIGISHLLGKNLVIMVSVAAAVLFVSGWLARALFADDGSELILSSLGSGWSRSARRCVIWLGWALALNAVIGGMGNEAGWAQAQIAVLTFPALLASAALLFLLSRLLSRNLAASAQNDDQRPYTDAVFSGVTWLVRAAAVIGVLLALGGYGAAGSFLVFPALYSLALLGVFFALEAVITGLVAEFGARGGFEAGSVRTGLIRVFVGAALLLAAAPALALAWGAALTDIADWWRRALEGITIGGQQITAADVLRFVVVFALGCILTALLQSILQRSVLPNTKLSPGAQRALITGVGYVGVILAGIAAVAMTNFDFTNIAIVAGALSVGIGFGLQTVVSNFVSGIILLVERPINVGDWIEVGSVSGTVRNISVRATQVETFNRSQVVLPNTDLIGGQVTNWTLENRRGRIILPIGVAYGTDARRIERLLLEIASAHPAVLEDPAPAVVFMNFGADALEFELRVILNDVSHMLSARSELNFVIAERFEQEGIAIPFPQRDIWVRNAADLRPEPVRAGSGAHETGGGKAQ